MFGLVGSCDRRVIALLVVVAALVLRHSEKSVLFEPGFSIVFFAFPSV